MTFQVGKQVMECMSFLGQNGPNTCSLRCCLMAYGDTDSERSMKETTDYLLSSCTFLLLSVFNSLNLLVGSVGLKNVKNVL